MTIIKEDAFNQNCYILKIDKKLVVIDPGLDYNKIKKALKDEKPDLILITHYHFDHVYSVNKLCNEFGIKAYINIKGKNLIHENSLFEKFNAKQPKIDENNLIRFKDSIVDLPSLEITAAPGHSIDSTLFKFKNNLFVGDVLFANGHGRIDLPDSNVNMMIGSLTLFLNMSDDITIYSGHGPSFKLIVLKEKIKTYIERLGKNE